MASRLAATMALFVIQLAAGDFRSATWGMTQTQVLASEPRKPSQIRKANGEELVQYDGIQVGGLPARVLYIFSGGKLVCAKYLFTAEHDELNDFIADYKQIEPFLQAAHGKPASERAVWEDDSTQLEPKSYLDQDRATPSSILTSDALVGLAVSLGHLRLYTQWDGAQTRIVHALSGQDHVIVHQIEYRSVEDGPRP